ANSSRCHSSRSMPSRPPTPSPKSQTHPNIRAPAAAATCASSRRSCAGSSQRTTPHRFRQRSRSIPHDPITIHPPPPQPPSPPRPPPHPAPPHSAPPPPHTAPACIVAPDRPPPPPPIHSRNAQLAPAKSKPRNVIDLKPPPGPLPANPRGTLYPRKSP